MTCKRKLYQVFAFGTALADTAVKPRRNLPLFTFERDVCPFQCLTYRLFFAVARKDYALAVLAERVFA
jgi:hypothetical protein